MRYEAENIMYLKDDMKPVVIYGTIRRFLRDDSRRSGNY